MIQPIAHKEAYTLWAGLESEFGRYHEAIAYIPITQTRLQDDLRRYLCLRCAGFLEKLTYDCIVRYLESTAGGPALEFAKSFFSHSPNLNSRTFTQLIARFGDGHARRFESFLTTPLRDSLNDLAAMRNPIAHGEITGGQKLDPERYRRLCESVYIWLTSELLEPIGTTTHMVGER